MTDREYKEAQDALILIGEITGRFNWNAFIKQTDEAETVAAILDPQGDLPVSKELKPIIDIVRQMTHNAIQINELYQNLKSKRE